MVNFYEGIQPRSKGAWVVHHGHKTSATVNGAAELPALDAAGKAASLLSQLAGTRQSTISKSRVDALAKAAGLNPLIELAELLKMLERHRVIDRSAKGDVEVLGLTSGATVRHVAEIFEEQNPTLEEKASIALAELTSIAPVPHARTKEFISDEFNLASARTNDLLIRFEIFGFIDAEGQDTDKLYFNGNLFRRDSVTKVNRVLDSLSPADQARTSELDRHLARSGCLSVEKALKLLGTTLFEKLRAAGMYDVNHVANPSGEFGFVTRPAAFHKFNDPLVDDAFDLAKALVAALFFGMTQSGAGRGRIGMISLLLRKLIGGAEVGPATAIGEDYRALETKGVIRVTKARSYGYMMKLLKKDVGEMALKILTTGEAASTNALDRPLPGKMTDYIGPEKTRSDFRRKQLPASKRMTQDVLEALRTRGTF